VATLRELGHRVDLRETTHRGHGEEIAATADPARVDVVIAAGGDGTINEVANGLARGAVRRGGPVLPLGIVPMGTANVLAHELGLPLDGRAMGRLLAGAQPQAIHPGRIRPDTTSDAEPGVEPDSGGARAGDVPRLFVQMLGAGLDARVVARINPAVKRRLGKGAYVLESLAQIAAGPRVAYRVTIDRPDGGREVHEVASAVLAKGRFYGGTFILAPRARLSAAHLQVCLFQHGGRGMALAYTAGMVLGLLDRMPGYRVVPALRARVEPLAAPTSFTGPADASRTGSSRGEPVQGDGDVLGHVPFTADLAPITLSVLAPPGL
jgi:diacylglycerol kinase family enzyme